MNTLGNKIENWDSSYENLKTTYTEEKNSPANLSINLQFEYVHEDIRKYLKDYKNAKVLECGCGGARTALFLAMKGFDVTCSDFSDEAINIARRNFAAYKARGRFIKDDILNSKLPLESFDCVISFGLLEHFEDLRPVIRSISRWVRHGGIQIHCIIPKKFSTQTIMDSLYFPFRLAKNVLKRDFRNILRRSYRDFPHFENSFSASQYCAVFEEEGNTIIKSQPGGIVYPLVALPLNIGNLLVRSFPGVLSKLMMATDRTESRALELIALKYYIVCKKK